MTKRKSKKTHVSLAKKAAWKAFSDFIRTRDKYICITCKRRGEGAGMHAGHFVSRIKTAIAWDERNVHAQCFSCNINKGGAWDDYYVVMQQRYGQEVIDELMNKRDEICQMKIEDYLKIEQEYKEKLESLEN